MDAELHPTPRLQRHSAAQNPYRQGDEFRALRRAGVPDDAARRTSDLGPPGLGWPVANEVNGADDSLPSLRIQLERE